MPEYPTVAELAPFLGYKWAICRATERNISKYGNCITRAQFTEAQRKAIEARKAV